MGKKQATGVPEAEGGRRPTVSIRSDPSFPRPPVGPSSLAEAGVAS